MNTYCELNYSLHFPLYTYFSLLLFIQCRQMSLISVRPNECTHIVKTRMLFNQRRTVLCKGQAGPCTVRSGVVGVEVRILYSDVCPVHLKDTIRHHGTESEWIVHVGMGDPLWTEVPIGLMRAVTTKNGQMVTVKWISKVNYAEKAELIPTL